jgi:hypothetical protein
MQNEQVYWEANKRIALAAPLPVRTSTYSPVSHAEIIEAIRTNAQTNNLKIVRDRMYTNRFGTRVTGFFDVEDATDFGNVHGLKMMFGYRNSYDKSMSVAFVAGASVFICGNGMISGDLMAFKRKHTGTVAEELNEKIQVGVDRMRDDFAKLNLEVDVMKNYSLTPRQKAEILGVMYFEKNMVTPTQLSIVKNELTNSEHFREDNAWSLYNNVTEALKKSHPIDIIRDHIKLHGFMQELVGIAPEEVGETVEAAPEAETSDAPPETEG